MALPCTPDQAQDLLRQFDKTVRLHQLYPATNATYLKAIGALRAAFRSMWELTGSVALQVSDTQFTWHDVVVLDEPEKASDSLPWTLFKDGVRQLVLRPGFEETELDALLAIIPKVRRAQDYDDDVLTLLWEQEFEHLSYRFIDTVTSEGAPLDPSATPGRWPASVTMRDDPRAAVEAARRRADAAGTGGLEVALRLAAPIDAEAERSRGEAMHHLRSALEQEYDGDLRCDVADALLDIFELQRDVAVRNEVVRHLDALTLHLLSARAFGTLAHLLRESALAAHRAPAVTPQELAGLAHLAERISDPALLTPLLEGVDAAELRPAADDVREFLDRLGSRALATMLQWSLESRHHDLRLLYLARADRLAEAEPDELVKLVLAEHDGVALEAMRRCGTQKLEAAVVALVRQLGHANESHRLAALTALAAMATPRALSGVERALGDASAHLRTMALKVLSAGGHRAVLPRITDLVQGRETREMDSNERRALFELYGTICGDAGVPWLSSQLTGAKGFFKRKSDPETRACAAAALGRVGTAKAREALQTAGDVDEPLIRRAVNSALARKTSS